MNAPPEGTKLGQYEIVKYFPESGQAVVCHAFDSRRKCNVALKIVSLSESHRVDRLKKEARALRDLQHPGYAGARSLIS